MVWQVTQFHGTAEHALEPTGPYNRRVIRRVEVSAPAVVLASSQHHSERFLHPLVSCATPHRKGGGGMVYVAPDQQLWVEITIPRHDPLWCDDVLFSFDWLGRGLELAFSTLGYLAVAHRSAPLYSDLGRICCFAGLGRGELVAHGKKVVGISQHRTHAGARFQCLVLREFDPVQLLACVHPTLVTAQLRDRLEQNVGVFSHDDDLFDAIIHALDSVRP